MILFVENIEKRRVHFTINRFADFAPVFQMFPPTKRIVMNSSTLQDALDNVAEYLSSHYLDAWVEDDRLTKSIKNKMLGAGLAAAMSLPATSIADDPPPDLTIPHVDYTTCDMPEETILPFGRHKADPFLWTIMQLESSGGENTDHPVITRGPFKGDKAIGRWALLRTTVREMIRRQKMDGTLDPKVAALYDKDRDKMDEFFKKKPHLELELARYLANHVLSNNSNDPEKGAFAWLMGHNLKNLDHNRVKDNYYVQRYRERDQVNPFKGKKLEKGEQSFEDRLLRWVEQRREGTREPMPNLNIARDPGRLHQDQPKPKEDIRGKIQDSIDSAKRARL